MAASDGNENACNYNRHGARATTYRSHDHIYICTGPVPLRSQGDGARADTLAAYLAQQQGAASGAGGSGVAGGSGAAGAKRTRVC